MKSSSKILLFGLLGSVLLMVTCLYLNLDKFTQESVMPPAPKPIEAKLDKVVTTEKKEPVPTVPKELPKDPTPPIISTVAKKVTPKEENESRNALEDSSLLYQIENQTVIIDGKLPLMDNNDSLKETMIRQCKDLLCQRKVLFSPKQKDPEWRSLAVETITLFQEENLPEARLSIQGHEILIQGTFKSRESKTDLDKLLEPYRNSYDINNSTIVKSEEKPTEKPVIKIDENQSKTEDNKSRVLETAQERVSTILKSKHINFHRNRAAITKKGKRTLNEIIKILKTIPDVHIEVQGYTDAGGKARINKWISSERAKSVKNYLGSHGLNPKNIKAKGFGETNLLFEDEPYNILNRRVEIVIKGKN